MSEKTIEKLREEGKVQKLIERTRNGDKRVRAESVKALGILGEKSAEADLIGALEDESEHVRSNAILALSQIGSERAYEKIIDHVNDSSWVIRHDTAIALGEFDKKDCKEKLKEWLSKEDDLEIKEKIIGSLGKVGDKETADFLIEMIGELEEKELDISEKTMLEEKAVQSLGDLGYTGSVEFLSKKVDDGAKEVRESAVNSLASIGDESSTEALISALDDPSWRIREDAVKAIGDIELDKIDEESLSSKLKDLLRDGSDYVVEGTLETIGELPMEELVDKVEEKIGSESPDVRSSAVMTLADIDGDRAVEPLIRAFRQERNPRVLWTISESLKKLNSQHLGEFKEEYDILKKNKKMILAVGLGKTGDRSVIETLLKGLKDDRWKIRQKSVEALRNIHIDQIAKKDSKKIMRSLEERMSDNDKWVRVECVKTLGKKIIEMESDHIDVERYVNSLEERANSEADKDVREALDKILKEIDSKVDSDRY